MHGARVGISGVLVAGLLVVGSPGSAEAGGDDAAVVSEWNQRAVSTLVADAATTPVSDFLYMGLVQSAVYDAVVGVTGGYAPYHFRGTAATNSSAPRARTSTRRGTSSASARWASPRNGCRARRRPGR